MLSVAQYDGHLELTKKFNLLPTEKDCVFKILRDIDTSIADGVNKLLGRFLKDDANVLPKLGIDICNFSISLNKFPRAFKLAKVKPVSLMQILSKVNEKVVYEQTNKFSSDASIFYKYQSGFRSNHSAEAYFYHFLMTKL